MVLVVLLKMVSIYVLVPRGALTLGLESSRLVERARYQ